ncbi:MAG: single-stranded-DNA-specific exonuclease RecJ [Chloroflexi bacterium]|nr:single-stranded-DNA-specific exonuclease RecJ [Chloroflexota bacterium]|tara:strand:- start:13704 stop:15410 length:1707 start_codon:yes stop_codon:yes gene_type:complete
MTITSSNQIQKQWKISTPPDLDGFADAGTGLPILIRTLLAKRGIVNTESARNYLATPKSLTDPTLMPNISKAVSRLIQACENNEKVGIFGDFDVDGITATTLLTEGLGNLGIQPIPYIPDRFSEGYGPNIEAIKKLADQDVTLLITADCGTSSVNEIDQANRLGMEVIIIDHHSIPTVLPPAYAIVNPKLNGSYGSEPAAVGVAYKVLTVLYQKMKRPYAHIEHQPLVALGTICDLVPLVGENRDFVRMGLEAIRSTNRPGILALAKESNLEVSEITAETLGWIFGPKINAAGRIKHGEIALRLLLTKNEVEAEILALELANLNQQRRHNTEKAIILLSKKINHSDMQKPLIITGDSTISSGIVGLAAAKIAEQFSRPSIVMEIGEHESRGSCRSANGFNIVELLQRHKDLFIKFGGHHGAAGFTINSERITELKNRFFKDANLHFNLNELNSELEIDEYLELNNNHHQTMQWLDLMGPYGIGNKVPVFLSEKIQIVGKSSVGKNKEHLQLKLIHQEQSWDAIHFNSSYHDLKIDEYIDIVFSLEHNNFRGKKKLQLQIKDLKRSNTE